MEKQTVNLRYGAASRPKSPVEHTRGFWGDLAKLLHLFPFSLSIALSRGAEFYNSNTLVLAWGGWREIREATDG